MNPDDIEQALTLAPVLVAADGGANAILNAGHMPHAVIGDFDSLEATARERIPPERLCHIPEQDSTDFEKALRNIEAPVVIGLGLLGARLDHQLAALNALHCRQDRSCVLVGSEEIVLHLPPELRLPTRAGETVSLFPLAPVSGQSTGLHWPINGLRFEPGGKSGTSNRATGRIEVRMETPGCIGIFPKRLLPDLVNALARPDAARWHARA